MPHPPGHTEGNIRLYCLPHHGLAEVRPTGRRVVSMADTTWSSISGRRSHQSGA